MPESKSKNKRKKRVRLVSLRTRTLKITLLGALVLGTVAFVVGLVLYTQVLMEQYESKAFMLAQGAASRISESAVAPQQNYTGGTDQSDIESCVFIYEGSKYRRYD